MESTDTNEAKPAAPKRERLGFLLSDTMRLTRRIASGHFESKQMTLSQAKALLGVHRQQGIRQVELAEIMEIQPITLARLLDQLAETGLIERRQDPKDRRAFQLFLTPAAGPTLAMIEQAGELFQAEALAGMTEAQIEALFFGLNRIRENLSALSKD